MTPSIYPRVTNIYQRTASLLHRLARHLAWWLACLFVLIAVVVGVGRELVGGIEYFHPALEKRLSEQTGLDVRFENVSGKWLRMSPELRFSNVVLTRPVPANPVPANLGAANVERPKVSPITIKRLSIRVSLGASLRSGKLRFRIHTRGANLHVASCGSSFCLLGQPIVDTGQDAKNARDHSLREHSWVQALPTVLVHRTHVIVDGLLETRAEADVSLLRLTWNGDQALLEGDFRLRARSEVHGRIHGRFQAEDILSQPTERGSVAAELIASEPSDSVIYLNLQHDALSDWLPVAIASKLPARLRGGEGHTEVWLRLANGRLASSTLRFDWNDISSIRNGIERRLADQFSGVLRWQEIVKANRVSENNDGPSSEKKSWQLDAPKLVWQLDDHYWQPGGIQLQVAEDQAVAGGHAKGWNYALRIADISFDTRFDALASWVPQRAAWRKALLTLQPSGRLRDFDLKVHYQPEGWTLQQASGQLSEYRQSPLHFIPGLENIGAAFRVEAQQAWVQLDERDLVLDYPAVFRDPIPIQSAQGSLGIDWRSDAIVLRSSPLHLITESGDTVTRLSLSLPKPSQNAAKPAEPPVLALQSTLRDVNGAHASRYLPAGVLHGGLIGWLDSAIQGGNLHRGDLVFNGPLGHHEYHDAWTVLLGFQVEAGRLRFLPDWVEPVTDLYGDVIVENGIVDAKVDRANYFGIAIQQAQVQTQHQDDHFNLSVNVRGQGDAAAGLRLLRESPLGNTVGDALSDLSLQGPLQVGFQLSTPLIMHPVLQGLADIQLGNSELHWPAQRLEAKNLQARFLYDLQKGIRTEGLQGSLLGGNAKGKLYHATDSSGRWLQLDLQGDATTQSLQTWLSVPQLALASGALLYDMKLKIAPYGSANQNSLSVTSQLNGVAIDLPAPFGKKAGSQRLFTVERHWYAHDPHDSHPQSMPYDASTRITYDELVDAIWQTKNGQAIRGAFALGGAKPRFAKLSPWAVQGWLTRFAWEEWAPYLKRLGGTASAKNDPTTSAFSGNKLRWLGELGDTSLTIASLPLADREFGPLQIDVNTANDAALLVLAGDHLRGQVSLPKSFLNTPSARSRGVPVSATLQLLKIPAAQDTVIFDAEAPDVAIAGKNARSAPDTGANDSSIPSIDPRLLPEMDLRIDRLIVSDREMGSWWIPMRATPKGLLAENANFHLNQADFVGALRWEKGANGSLTAFQGKGEAGDIADVSRAWGYTPALDSKTASLEADLQWPGAPWQFSMALAQGQFKARLMDGHFLKVGNSTTGRYLGLLNFQTWLSRLQLRFKDLSDSEMPFDKITGRFALANQQIQVSRLKIDSPTVKMKLNGNLDLAQDQLAMQWDVTLPVTRNLILPAAVVGGLPGAATAFVLDKVLSSQLDKLTTLTYDVTGEFNNPKTALRIPLP
ncbi:Hypothetical protein HDN1F_06230 [gamma proteobacterium HdN1]|nr:Hypothetical protein HDN1F_06230 [gamma proteobacterium HdN1]